MQSSPNVERCRRCKGRAIRGGAPSCIKGYRFKHIRTALQTLPYDTPVCLETSRTLHFPCAATADMDCTARFSVVATYTAVNGRPLL
ncbi:hypothetical protein TNIN_494881 [Trichonephila inaurata madagascariensis]|uniref:Uncharacterized protein n=1 Tax=Trichonephila inaurata madagascariensis TaxID=2747483 RepID=A0A8X6WX15_9ARAC|nr:hypothetical protein TNIN_494881 [Trichonephila inaurata madagascariensis]